MPLNIEAEAPPLRVDEAGAVRVGKTRVLFVLVVRAFQQGETPEGIIEMFDVLDLADVYGALAYYLRHRAEVDEYLMEYDRQAEEVRKTIDEYQNSRPELRAKAEALKARIAAARASATETVCPVE